MEAEEEQGSLLLQRCIMLALAGGNNEVLTF